jgi:hypothetical protein
MEFLVLQRTLEIPTSPSRLDFSSSMPLLAHSQAETQVICLTDGSDHSYRLTRAPAQPTPRKAFDLISAECEKRARSAV